MIQSLAAVITIGLLGFVGYVIGTLWENFGKFRSDYLFAFLYSIFVSGLIII